VKAMILVNAEDKVVGRLASFVAKKAIEGKQITVVNAEKALITGSRDDALKKMKTKLGMRGKGNPEKGPKFSKMPDRVLRMSIRGMLPWKSSRGKQAYRRVYVYIGIPEEFSGSKFEEIGGKQASKRFVELGTVCRLLGAKW